MKYLYLQDLWLVGNSRNFSWNFGNINDNETNYEYSFLIQGEVFHFHRRWPTTIKWLWSLTKAWEELSIVTSFKPNIRLKKLIIEHLNIFWFK